MPVDSLKPPSDAKMGCLPRLSYPGQHLPIFGSLATAPLLSRSEMHDVDLSPMDAPTLDQGDQSSCTGCGFATAFRHLRKVANLSVDSLAWSTLYGPCNGGSDAGSPLDAVLAQLMQVGICPQRVGGEDFIDPFNWQGFYNATWPEHWANVAAGYRLLEAWDCPSFDHVLSALHAGFVCPLGVFWPGGGGHCVTAVGWDNHASQFKIQNTWGPHWGQNGYGWLPERLGLQGVPYFGAFALRVPSFAPIDPTPPNPRP